MKSYPVQSDIKSERSKVTTHDEPSILIGSLATGISDSIEDSMAKEELQGLLSELGFHSFDSIRLEALLLVLVKAVKELQDTTMNQHLESIDREIKMNAMEDEIAMLRDRVDHLYNNHLF